MATSMSELLFGDSLQRTVEHIITSALHDGKPEAFRAAEAKLLGLRTFLIFLRSEGSIAFTYELMALSNEATRMWRLAEHPEVAAIFLRDLKKS
jgi:hypothetical protein